MTYYVADRVPIDVSPEEARLVPNDGCVVWGLYSSAFEALRYLMEMMAQEAELWHRYHRGEEWADRRVAALCFGIAELEWGDRLSVEIDGVIFKVRVATEQEISEEGLIS